MKPALLIIVTIMFASAHRANSDPLRFDSGANRVDMLELYTSEGCSSCPPADSWLSRLLEDDGLWQRVVPVAFHVDYWDYLGWKDPYASPEFSKRQRRYASGWRDGSVYTPGFVLNGEEWRGFFEGRNLPRPPEGSAGKLSGVFDGGRIDITYEPRDPDRRYIAHVAVMGFGIHQKVTRGENAGRTLPHDFVVLDYDVVELDTNHSGRATLSPPDIDGRTGIAVWVSTNDHPKPLQATGSWLP